jgi:hypothetical protein
VVVGRFKSNLGSSASGIGSGDEELLPTTKTLLAAMSVQPSSARKALINNAIIGLSSVWSKLDLFYMMCAHDVQAAGLNWINPATFPLLPVNAPTFTVDSNYAGDGATSYLRTQYIPSVNGIAYTKDGASMGVASLNEVNAGMDMGWFTAGTSSAYLSLRNAGNHSGRIHDSTTLSVANASSKFVGGISRIAAASRRGYNNGTPVGIDAVASVALATGEFFICGRNNDNTTVSYSTKQLCAAFVGGGLLQAEFTAISDAIRAFVNTINPGALP